MKSNKKLKMLLVMGMLAGTLASGCNTFKGAGRDIQKGGQAVENAAEEVQNNK
jgi:entericidin B